MVHRWSLGRVCAASAYATRKRMTACLALLIGALCSLIILDTSSTRLPREDLMAQKLVALQARVQYLQTMFQARQEEILDFQMKLLSKDSQHRDVVASHTTITAEVLALLNAFNGSYVTAAVSPKNLNVLRTSFVFQLLPHLLEDEDSLRPAFHMSQGRAFVDVVIGIPTVRRDKESYLLITLENLLTGLAPNEVNSTLIVVFVGETDLEYVVKTARQIEMMFPRQVANGMIEVLSPSTSYYPSFTKLKATLGDSFKRFKWRTKQNLDTLYLMAYAQTKGTYYLMLEDDVIAKKEYMSNIKDFTTETTIAQPQWFFIEFCPVGGIGKLFRSSDLLHFITYVQLFYTNLPIDWLLESYLADRICTIDKTSKACGKNKLKLRPKFKTSLFQHVGLYSSLRGKIQKIKQNGEVLGVTFFPHDNPPLASVWCDIKPHAYHSILEAYKGITFFWGINPKKGDLVEFHFEQPTDIERYTFRSSNYEHTSDKFYDTVVEVLPARAKNLEYIKVGSFDEFGLADGKVAPELGPLSAIRLKVMRTSSYWVILSEIDLKVRSPTNSSGSPR